MLRALGSSVGAGPSDGSAGLGATSAVIAEGVLYIAQIAPTQVYILRDGAINALPDERELDPGDEFDIQIEQEVDLFRAPLQAGDCLVLTSTDLRHELTEREIRGMLLCRSAQEAAHDMCALVAQRGGKRCEVLVVQIEGVEAGAFTPVDVSEPEADELPFNGRLEDGKWEAVRPRQSPRVDQVTDRRPAPRSARAAPGNRSLTQRLASLPVAILTLIVVLPVLAARVLGDLLSGGNRRTRERQAPIAREQPTEQLEDDRTGLRDLRAAGPGARGPAARSPRPVRPLEHLGTDLSGRRDPLLVRRRRTFPGPGTLLFGLSLVLLIVMAVVLVLRNSGDSPPTTTDTTPTVTPNVGAHVDPTETATDLIRRAEDMYRLARDSDPSQNRAATLLLLRDARDFANQAFAADTKKLLTKDINRLLDEIVREEERLNRVHKLVPSSTIGEFDSAGVGSALEALDVRLDAKFVIDAVSGRVLSYATARQGATALRKGDVVASVTVQDPIAVIDRSMSAIVVDNRFNIFSLEEDQNPRLLRITGTEQWENPVAFDNFNNNLYVLDPASNSIFKYQWTAGGYELGPTSYLDPREDIDISDAIDMAIDGDIFILFADGTVRMFSAGAEVSFSISGLEGDSLRPSRIFTDVDSDSLYLADPDNGRIVEIDKREGSAGAFVRQFKYAGSDDFFGDIRGLWVSEIDGQLIVLGKDKLRQFVLPRLADDAASSGA